MKAKSIVALVGLVLVLIMACSEHTIEPATEYADGRVVGTIHGIVVDFQTNARFDTSDVQVSWVSGGQVHTKNLDTLGYYIITDLVPGYYDLTFSGNDGYAVTKIDSVYVPTLEEVNDGSYATEKDYEHVVARNVWLYPLNAYVKGTIYAKQNNQSVVPANGATVVFDYSLVPMFAQMMSSSAAANYHISPDHYTTTADVNGEFMSPVLPAAASVAIYVEEYAEGSNEYGWDGTIINLIEKDTLTVDNIELEINGDAPVILSNNFANETAFAVRDNLVLTFNKPMDATTFEVSLVDENWNDVDIDVSWLNGVTLTINPVVALEYGTEYTLNLQGQSTTDNTVFENGVGGPVQIDFKTLSKYNPVVVTTNFYDIEHNTHVGNFELGTNLTATFSKAINTTSFDAVLYLDNNSNGYFNAGTDEEIESTLTWNTDGTVLTIDPIVNLQTEHMYYVSFAGWSTDSMAIEMPDIDGNLTEDDLFFETIPAIKFVSTTLENAQGLYEDVSTMDATTGLGPNIEVKFSRALDLTNDATEVYLLEYDDAENDFHLVRTTVQATADGYGFVITPEFALESHEDYYLFYDVYSDIPGDNAHVSQHQDAASYYGSTPMLKFMTVISVSVPSISGFVMNTAASAIDWNTTDIQFRIRTVEGADEYAIYAKGSTKNSDLILVPTTGSGLTTPAQPQQNFVYTTVRLPAQFDYYPNDGYGVTPFVNGETISFYATAINEAGESVKSAVVGVTDGAAPNAQVVTQSGSVDNTGGTSIKAVTFRISAANGEYLHSDIPTWQFLDSNNNTFVLTTAAVGDATLNNDKTQWTVIINVPITNDYSADTARITIKDSNGQSGVFDYLMN